MKNLLYSKQKIKYTYKFILSSFVEICNKILQNCCTKRLTALASFFNKADKI